MVCVSFLDRIEENTMKSKKFLKSSGSALILGSTLTSLAGQQNVNAGGPQKEVRFFSLNTK